MNTPTTRAVASTVATSGIRYHLHNEPGVGWSLWIGDEPSERVCIEGDLPATAREDIVAYADRADEETRVLLAEAAAEFGGGR